MTIDLSRFVEAHERDFEQALSEIRAGRKQSHWIWYVFPQIAGLARSSTAAHYAIGSVEEARAFLAHPVLGSNYRRIVAATREQVVERGGTIHDLLGSPDDLKLVSSLTLFRAVADDVLASDIDRILDTAAAQGLGPCARTAAFLGDS